MMQLKDIQQLSEEDLRRLAQDPQIPVPDGLAARLEETVCAAALAQGGAEALPEGMALEGDTVFWTEPLENRYLDCRVRLLAPGSGKRTEWISHRLVVEESEDDGEWD